MRYVISILFLIASITFVGSTMASPPGKTVEYPDGEQGKVIFDGSTHSVKQGMKCFDCHPKFFQMKKGLFKMTKEDHGNATKGCGICHNGKKAFSQSDKASCGKCHKKTGITGEETLKEKSATEKENVSEEKTGTEDIEEKQE